MTVKKCKLLFRFCDSFKTDYMVGVQELVMT